MESKGLHLERLRKYKKREREAMTKNIVMSKCGHFSDMHSGVVTSSLYGGCKDNTIDAILCHWNLWRLVVLECLTYVQESMREALGDEEVCEVLGPLCLQSLEALMSPSSTIREFLKGYATALVLRTLIH